MSAPIGQRIGNYRMGKLLGRGGMGSVFLAEHERIERRVAIKVLHPALAAHGDAVQRFFNEALAANRIQHPGIVEIYDCGEDETFGFYMVMEYLAGKTLDELLEAGAGPEHAAAACELIDGVAQALAAAHQAKIVHRDLKPANIFVIEREDQPQLVKLVDFGVAKLAEAPKGVHTRVGQVMGTPRYMAPEQFEDSRSVDQRADIYALGLIAYRLLCGRGPFDQLSGADLVEAHQLRMPDPPSRVNPRLPAPVDAVLLQAVAKSPADRFASVDAFVAALVAAVGSSPEHITAETEPPLGAPEVILEVELEPDPEPFSAAPVPQGAPGASATPGRAASPAAEDTHAQTEPGRERPTQRLPRLDRPVRHPGARPVEPLWAAAPPVLTRGDSLDRPTIPLPAIERSVAGVGDGAAAGGAAADGDSLDRRLTSPLPALTRGIAGRAAPQGAEGALLVPPRGRLARRIPLLGGAVAVLVVAILVAVWVSTSGSLPVAGHVDGSVDVADLAAVASGAALTEGSPREDGAMDVGPALDRGGPGDAQAEPGPPPDASSEASAQTRRPRSVAAGRPAKVRGTLQVIALDAGRLVPAQILADGRDLGWTPLYRTDIAPGSLVLEARRPGYRPARQRLRLASGAVRKVIFQLVRVE